MVGGVAEFDSKILCSEILGGGMEAHNWDPLKTYLYHNYVQ